MLPFEIVIIKKAVENKTYKLGLGNAKLRKIQLIAFSWLTT